jgi:menaquinone-9 beta-reductase
MQTHKAQVIVVGAGPTGLHVAGLLAHKGLSVMLIDQQPPGKTGAQWINGVPRWMFSAADLPDPVREEIFLHAHTFTMIDPSNQSRLSLNEPEVADLDMRELGKRLHLRAEPSDKICFFYNTAATQLKLDANQRPISLEAETKLGSKRSKHSFEAALFIDASGLSSIIRKQIPRLHHICPPVAREDLCIAAQEVREITDPVGAKTFLKNNQGVSGEILAWLGIAGGYSLLRIHIDKDYKQVTFLTGAIALPHYPTGTQMIHQFIEKNPWVGRKHFGGQRALPLRRPYSTLVAPGVALLGDSACQVYSAHGSGIGISLVAAKMLADVVFHAAKCGQDLGSLTSLWPYTSGFHKRFGALLGASDAFRRFSQTLTPLDVHDMMSSGLMSPRLALDSLAQLPIKPRVREIKNQIKSALKHKSLFKKLLPHLLKIPLIEMTPLLYPAEARYQSMVSVYEKCMRKLID